MRKNDKKYCGIPHRLLLIPLILILLCLTACAPPDPSATYGIHTPLQAAYLAGSVDGIDAYAEGTEELSRPLPISLDFSKLSDNYTEIELSENASFNDAFILPLIEKKVDVYNTKVGTIYYYRLKNEKGKHSQTYAFLTEDATPRNLYVDGVTNVRDLGGYTTPKGKIRQGMIYRTGRLNQNHTDEPTLKITEKGIDTMLRELKVKTEIDLRRISDNEIGGLTASVLGESVLYVNCPMTANADMPTANSESIRKFFATLADPDNYPLFYHCSIGTDRTGFCSYLILTILGADTESIYRDYLFSNFGSIGGDRSVRNVLGFDLFIALYTGATQKQKAENYLLSLGVTAEEIAALRAIMIE